MENFKNLSDTISNARDLVNSCKPKLISIKNALGSTDKFYLEISGDVVNNALGMVVTVVNDEQELFLFSTNPSSANIQKLAEITVRRYGHNSANASNALMSLVRDQYTAMENLKSAVRDALNVSTVLGGLDMISDLRTRYNNNHSTLKSIASQLGISTYSGSTSSGSSSSNSSGGCYIATMAYGDHNHSQVMILRQFRDEILNKFVLGRWFIRIYYRYAPLMVKHLKDKKTTNNIIRSILNLIIKIIK